MQLDILTPDKKVFSGEVSAVSVPGAKGSFEVLNKLNKPLYFLFIVQ